MARGARRWRLLLRESPPLNGPPTFLIKTGHWIVTFFCLLIGKAVDCNFFGGGPFTSTGPFKGGLSLGEVLFLEPPTDLKLVGEILFR